MAGEVITGRAAGVRYTVHVSGDRDGVSTRHHTLFKIGATTVVYASDSPPVIGEGDRLVVAGRRKGQGMLQAEAYLNQTAGVTGNSGLRSNLAGAIFGLVMCVTALVLILLGLLPNDPETKGILRVIVGVFGLFCGSFGVYCLYRWQRIRDAARLVRAAEGRHLTNR
jgi:hypothetical protein